MFGLFFEGNRFFEAVVGLWRNVLIRNDSGEAADGDMRNATDYLTRQCSSRFNMCNKFISISSAINIEPVRPSTSTHLFILAHCVFEFDPPAL